MAAHCPLIAFLCLSAALLTTGAAVGNDQGCPEGWTPFGTRCFKFFDSNSTWTESEKSCQSYGANLASIHSAEEKAFILDLIEEATDGYRWWTSIGGQFQDGWTWTDGSVWDYSNWFDFELSLDRSGFEENLDQSGFFVVIHWPDPFWYPFPASFPVDLFPMDHICAKDASPKA